MLTGRRSLRTARSSPSTDTGADQSRAAGGTKQLLLSAAQRSSLGGHKTCSTAQRAPPGEGGQIHGFQSWADPYEADGILAHPTAPEPSAADLKRKGGFIQHGPKPRAERSLEVHRIPSFPSKALFSSFLPRVKTLPLNGQIQA